jgi:LEA14-like dessication related protein
MKRNLIIGSLIAGAGLIGFGIYKYFKKQIDLATDFEWSILKIDFSKITTQNLSGNIKFRFHNKSDIEVLIKEFYLDLYFNREYIGWLRDSKEFLIPAKGYNDIEFEFTLNPQYVISNIIDIIAIATKKKDALFGLVGYMKVQSGFIKTTIKIDCECSTKNLDCNCK